MVLKFQVAVINKGSLLGEALKRFKDRGFSKKTLENFKPNVSRAKFIRRDRGFSIWEVPLKKIKKKRKKR